MGVIALNLWSLLAVMAVGYIAVKVGGVPNGADKILSRVIFNVCLPAMLFVAIYDADVSAVFSRTALVNIFAGVILFATFFTVGRRFFHLDGGAQTVLALVASYTNVGNIGLAYLAVITGHPEAGAPLILFQLCVMAPTAFVLLDRQSGGTGSILRQIGRALVKPPVVGLLLGAGVAFIHLAGAEIEVPQWIMMPVQHISDATVPLLMLSLGVSFGSTQLPRMNRANVPMWMGVAARVIGGPLIAWLIGLAFGLPHEALVTVVVMGCLPVANNVFIYAQRYDAGVELARDAVALTTILSVPVLLVAVALLHA